MSTAEFYKMKRAAWERTQKAEQELLDYQAMQEKAEREVWKMRERGQKKPLKLGTGQQRLDEYNEKRRKEAKKKHFDELGDTGLFTSKYRRQRFRALIAEGKVNPKTITFDEYWEVYEIRKAEYERYYWYRWLRNARWTIPQHKAFDKMHRRTIRQDSQLSLDARLAMPNIPVGGEKWSTARLASRWLLGKYTNTASKELIAGLRKQKQFASMFDETYSGRILDNVCQIDQNKAYLYYLKEYDLPLYQETVVPFYHYLKNKSQYDDCIPVFVTNISPILKKYSFDFTTAHTVHLFKKGKLLNQTQIDYLDSLSKADLRKFYTQGVGNMQNEGSIIGQYIRYLGFRDVVKFENILRQNDCKIIRIHGDSITFLGDMPDLAMITHPTKLGSFKIEYKNCEGIFYNNTTLQVWNKEGEVLKCHMSGIAAAKQLIKCVDGTIMDMNKPNAIRVNTPFFANGGIKQVDYTPPVTVHKNQ